MDVFQLTLYTREGCCLCEGLQEKLNSICINDLFPELELCVKDIDSTQVSNFEQQRFSMQVPVLTLQSKKVGQSILLPRVSARLNKEAFFNWLQKQIKEKIEML